MRGRLRLRRVDDLQDDLRKWEKKRVEQCNEANVMVKGHRLTFQISENQELTSLRTTNLLWSVFCVALFETVHSISVRISVR